MLTSTTIIKKTKYRDTTFLPDSSNKEKTLSCQLLCEDALLAYYVLCLKSFCYLQHVVQNNQAQMEFN